MCHYWYVDNNWAQNSIESTEISLEWAFLHLTMLGQRVLEYKTPLINYFHLILEARMGPASLEKKISTPGNA